MKISKKVWLVIGVVILVAAIAILFSIYFQDAREQKDLSERLSQAQTLLPTLIDNRDKLEDDLTQAESSLSESQAEFPEVVESIEYGEDFFKIAYGQNLNTMAAGCGVDLTSLTAKKQTNETVGSVTYSVSSFTVKVKGNTDNLLKFIDAIGTGIDYEPTWSFQLPWSVDVKSVTMTSSSATINLDIYGY